MCDESVPWMTAGRIAERILTDDVRILLIKDGGHRLSRDQDLANLRLMLGELVEDI